MLCVGGDYCRWSRRDDVISLARRGRMNGSQSYLCARMWSGMVTTDTDLARVDIGENLPTP